MDRRTFLALASAAGVGLTAGCSTGPAERSATTASSGGSDDASAFPVRIKHAHDVTKITERPTRVATLGWSDADMAISLGIVPVGASSLDGVATNARGSTDYFDAELTKVGGKQPARYSEADGAPVDEIAKLRPDVILATNGGVTKEEYAKLSKIAPVVPHAAAPYTTPWKQSLTMVGQALGAPAEARRMTARTEKAIRDAKAKYPQFKGTTYAWTYFIPNDTSKIGLTTPVDLRARMMVTFGFEPAPFVERSTKDAKQYSAWVSAEKAPDLDAQILVFAEIVKGQDRTVRKHRLLGQIPALKRGAYESAFQDQAMTAFSAPSPLSIPYAIEHFLPRLATAVRKADRSP